MMVKQAIWASACGAVVGILLCSCSSNSQSEASLSGRMTLYTAELEGVITGMVADFNQLYPEINVTIFRSGGTDVVSRLQAEERSGGIQADAIFITDGAYIRHLAEKGLLLSYEPEGSEYVADHYHYNDHTAHEIRATFTVLGYNPDLVETPPQRYADLLDPQYQGRIGLTNPLFNGAGFTHMGTLVGMPEFGWEFFEGLKANGVKFEQGNTGLAAKIATGEYALAHVADVTARRLIMDGSPLAYVWPEEGAIDIPTPFAILKDSEVPELAQTFLDYLYSKPAQQKYVDLGYVSVRSDVPLPEGVPAGFKVIPVDQAYIDANREQIRERFTNIFGGA